MKNFPVLQKWSITGAFLAALTLTTLPAQTQLKPGFNLFSPEQDIEIGKQSAVEVEKQMPVLRKEKVQSYIRAIGKRLADNTPGHPFPYQFKVVDIADVNAFALPGGFMYIHRGLIETAEEEAELAGVMAHEISHVALRHGTNQASKAYMSQAGLSILGILLGGRGGTTAEIISAVGGFGLNATFLKFSRDAEKQADLLGTQILARSGYDPMAMADFFQTLREVQGHDPGKLEVFFSSHPAPANRSLYVSEEIRHLTVKQALPVGSLQAIQAILKGLPPAPTMKELAEGKRTGSPRPESSKPDAKPADLSSVDMPSDRMIGWESTDRQFRIWYPANWQSVESSDRGSVTFMPENGAIRTDRGNHIVCGVILNRMDYSDRKKVEGPFRGSSFLERATNALVASIRDSNRYLNVGERSARYTRAAGRESLMVQLSGISPATGAREIVAIHTIRLNGNKLLYSLYIAPESRINDFLPAFQKMADSLQIPR